MSVRESPNTAFPPRQNGSMRVVLGLPQGFAFGNDEAKLGEHAWYCNNSGACIHSVGHKKPNAWGLFDVHGSVWEWCQDRYGDYPLSPVTDPTGPSSGTFRLVRGGAWDGHARLSRSANRYRFNPKCRFHLIGFRVAKDL